MNTTWYQVQTVHYIIGIDQNLQNFIVETMIGLVAVIAALILLIKMATRE